MFLSRKSRKAALPIPARRTDRRPPVFESLENRQLMTAVVVNSISDSASGPGIVTLNDALQTANASASPTTILFDPTVFNSPKTIDIVDGFLLTFQNSKPVTIIGPATGVTLNGQSNIGFLVEQGSDVNMSDIKFTNFYSAGSGAIFLDEGNLGLKDVTLENSKAYYGGAVQVYGDGIATITNSTLSGNSSTGNGGAISNTGALTLINDTFYGNSSGQGGALATDSSHPANIEGVTFADNSAKTGGGAIDNFANALNFTVGNSIVAGNTTSSGDGPDLTGDFTSKGHNLFGVRPDSEGGFPIASDLTGTAAQPLNAKLGSLANNGGPTLTLLPQAGSPALGAGSTSLVPVGTSTDQRGLPRIANGKVDIGSVQTQTASSTDGIITGTVFNDHNASGTKDVGDSGLANVKVFVDLKNSGVFASGDPYAMTNAAGQYSFTLKPGFYSIDAQPPAGYHQTFPYGGDDQVVQAVSGKTTANLNFGLTTTVHLGGIVQFNDDGSLSPYASAKVTISTVGGGPTFTRMTDATGHFSIGGLPNNKAYKVTLTVPPGYVAAGSGSQTTGVLGSGKGDDNLNFTIKPFVDVGFANRYIKTTVSAPGNSQPPDTKSAVGNVPFMAGIGVDLAGHKTIPQGTDNILVSADVIQNSTISSSEFTDWGTVSATESDSLGGHTTGAYGQGESYLSETFTLNTAVHYSIAASFSSTSPTASSSFGTLSLIGPGNAPVFSTLTGNAANHSPSINKSGTLAAGTYTLTFDLKAYDNSAKNPNVKYSLDFKL